MIDEQDLTRIANWTMPFGRFKGTPLIQLPEEYLLWFVDRGFPAGKLGQLMQMTLEIKINGLEKLIYPLQDSPVSRVTRDRRFRFSDESE